MTDSRKEFEELAITLGMAITMSQGTLDDLRETDRAWKIWQAGRASMLNQTIKHFEEIGSGTPTHIGDVIVDLRMMTP